MLLFHTEQQDKGRRARMKVARIREDGSQKHIPALEHKIEMQRLPYLFMLGEVSTILRKMK
jgi:hypothetical protein